MTSEAGNARVHVRLTYPDGRDAALEVTSQEGVGVQQRNALTRDEVPNPGKWTWSISIGDVEDLPELLKRYARIITTSGSLWGNAVNYRIRLDQ